MTLWKQTLGLRGWSFFNIPLLFMVNPSVLAVDAKRCEVKIPLTRMTRNHVKSMYFAVLAMGADLAGGVILLEAIKRSKAKMGFIFKDFTADFVKRAEADVHFICEEGDKVQKLVAEAIRTKKRTNVTVNMFATTPKKTGNEPIAKFTLTMSVKVQ